MKIEQSIELIQKTGVLLSYDKEYKDIIKDLSEQQSNVKRENTKLKDMRLTVEKSYDVLFNKNEKGLQAFKDTYISKDDKTGKNKINYNNFAKSVEKLLENPKEFIKGFKKHEATLRTIEAQGFSEDIKKTLEARTGHIKKTYAMKAKLNEQTTKNFKQAKEFGMTKEFSQFINSKNPYYTNLVKNYQQALDHVKDFKKEHPQAFNKILNEKNLDDRIVKKHALVQRLAKEQFATKNKAQNKAQVKVR